MSIAVAAAASPRHDGAAMAPRATVPPLGAASPHVPSLLEAASRVAGAAVALEELALHWDFLPLAVRDIVTRHTPDARLRRLEQLLPDHTQYEPELQAEWRRRCRTLGLHVDVLVSSDTLFRDDGVGHATRDARRVFWAHRFRSVLRADDSDSPTPAEVALFADVVAALKVNARELTPRNVARLLRLRALRRVELHHPTAHHGETLARGLAGLLAAAPALEALGFFHGRLSAALLEQIAAALAARQRLVDAGAALARVQSVEFVSVKLKTAHDHAALVALLQQPSTVAAVASVRISGVVADFAGDQNRRLLDALLALPRLAQLSLEHNDLEDDAFAGRLSTTTAAPLALRHARLGSNAITHKTLETLASATQSGRLSLERLELRNNQHVGDAGVVALAPMVRAPATALTHLDVRNCHFGLDGARALLEALGANTTLRSLDLSYNFLGAGAGDVLAEFLLTNTTLERLHVNYVGLGRAGCSPRLQVALRANASLRVLSVGANRLRDQGAVLLAKAIARRAQPFEALDLSGNLITSDGLHELARVLEAREGGSDGDKEEDDRGDHEPPFKRPRRRVEPTSFKDEDEGPRNLVLRELGLLNNDLQGPGDGATRTAEALEALRRVVGKVHSNEWSSRRSVYDDEV